MSMQEQQPAHLFNVFSRECLCSIVINQGTIVPTHSLHSFLWLNWFFLFTLCIHFINKYKKNHILFLVLRTEKPKAFLFPCLAYIILCIHKNLEISIFWQLEFNKYETDIDDDWNKIKEKNEPVIGCCNRTRTWPLGPDCTSKTDPNGIPTSGSNRHFAFPTFTLLSSTKEQMRMIPPPPT